jgi:hypothetical protein
MMAHDLVGKVFHNYTVTAPADTDAHYHKRWMCRCACGQRRLVLEKNLLSGNSKSCGCLRMKLQRKSKGK